MNYRRLISDLLVAPMHPTLSASGHVCPVTGSCSSMLNVAYTRSPECVSRLDLDDGSVSIVMAKMTEGKGSLMCQTVQNFSIYIDWIQILDCDNTVLHG